MKVAVTICVLLTIASAWRFAPFRKAQDFQPLQITVLSESLCPDCMQFIGGSFSDAIVADGIDKLVNITIVPFGNAREKQVGDKYEFTCQHGTKECLGNAIQNCLFAHVEKKTAQKVMVCLDSKIQTGDTWENVVAACGTASGIDLSSLITCANSDEGMTLVHQAAQMTDPAHQYVPWVLVNGKHDRSAEDQILDNLVRYACSQYTGTEPVPACQNKKLKDDQPLQIVALTESLCPYCQEFIIGSFSTAINTKDIEKIANITVIPFGNAKETQSGGHYVFTCQHGPDECLGNAIQNCISATKDKNTAQKALVCLEAKKRSGSAWEDAVTACGSELGADFSQVMTCANGPDGEMYTHQAAQNTDPNHKYVPWITVNGVHDETAEGNIFDDLVTFACQNYKGSVKIDACSSMKKSRSRSYNHSIKELFDI
jgi:interferon gamma-inducible protein 30